MLALIETGTHVIGDAVIRPFRSGAVPTARHRLRSVGPGLLLRGARGFHAPELVRATLAQRAHCLGRTRKNSVLRPPEILPDGACLARSYPAPEARRRHEQGIELRVVADARDTPAGPGRGVLTELAAERLPPRRPRHTPRAVTPKMSTFPLKRSPPPGSAPTPPPIAATSVRVLWP